MVANPLTVLPVLLNLILLRCLSANEKLLGLKGLGILDELFSA